MNGVGAGRVGSTLGGIKKGGGGYKGSSKRSRKTLINSFALISTVSENYILFLVEAVRKNKIAGITAKDIHLKQPEQTR